MDQSTPPTDDGVHESSTRGCETDNGRAPIFFVSRRSEKPARLDPPDQPARGRDTPAEMRSQFADPQSFRLGSDDEHPPLNERQFGGLCCLVDRSSCNADPGCEEPLDLVH
jgi:hypothetical protein